MSASPPLAGLGISGQARKHSLGRGVGMLISVCGIDGVDEQAESALRHSALSAICLHRITNPLLSQTTCKRVDPRISYCDRFPASGFSLSVCTCRCNSLLRARLGDCGSIALTLRSATALDASASPKPAAHQSSGNCDSDSVLCESIHFCPIKARQACSRRSAQLPERGSRTPGESVAVAGAGIRSASPSCRLLH